MAKKEKTLSPLEKNKIEYDKFVKNLEGKTKEELLKIEQDLIKEIDAHDTKVGKTSFKVKNADEMKEAAEIARYFLNKQKVQFNYAIGMVELYEAFAPDMKTIPYPVLDAVLMNLGQLEYDGYDEWKKILKFNDFTKSYSDAYTELKARTYLLAEEHSTLQNKLGLNDPTAANQQK